MWLIADVVGICVFIFFNQAKILIKIYQSLDHLKSSPTFDNIDYLNP